MNGNEQLLYQISVAQPANEAEVETKILLHIFRLLGYKDLDRADKPSISMYFGREKKQKQPDFIIYNGAERAISNALIAVEAKAIGESLESAELQVKSYATWAGTPYYVVCNGKEFFATRFISSVETLSNLKFQIRDIIQYWDILRNFLQRSEVILAKERLDYLANYLPNVEELPVSEFFKEYLMQLAGRFIKLKETKEALSPPNPGDIILPQIPITVEFVETVENKELIEQELAKILSQNMARVYVEGLAGSGKSTLCHRIINYIVELAIKPGANLLPIHIKLTNGIPSSLVDALKQACTEMGVRFFPMLYQKSMSAATVILVLDGLDELFHEDINMDKLNKLVLQSCNMGILITSRPIGANYNDILSNQGFLQGRIRELKETEVYSIFSSYLGNEQVKELVGSNIINIRSPLMALMVINIIQTSQDWKSLSTYTLYERYIGVLHSYFIAPTVRGNDNSISVDQILSAFSAAAIIIKQHSIQSGITLGQVMTNLKPVFSDEIISSLLNTGLVTSINGKANFIHKSFEDFGIAWRLISSLRIGDLDGFTVRGVVSDASYILASSALTYSDEEILRQYLSHSNGKVRKRAIGILRHSCNMETTECIYNLLPYEKSQNIFNSMGQFLVMRRHLGAMKWLLKLETIPIKQKLRIINYAINESTFRDYMNMVINIAEQDKNYEATTCAIELAFIYNDLEMNDRLVELICYESIEKRIIFCSIIRRYRYCLGCKQFALKLLEREYSARVIIRILNSCRSNLFELTPLAIESIFRVLNNAIHLKSSDLKHLNSIIRFINNNKQLKIPLTEILQICSTLVLELEKSCKQTYS